MSWLSKVFSFNFTKLKSELKLQIFGTCFCVILNHKLLAFLFLVIFEYLERRQKAMFIYWDDW